MENQNNIVRILNVVFNNITKKELLESFHEGLLLTPNIDVVLNNNSNIEVYQAYKKGTFIVCDSRVLGKLAPILGYKFKEIIPGSLFFEDYYMYHAEDPDCRIFLLGAAEGVAEKAKKKINEIVGRDIVVGAYSPPMGFEKNKNEIEKIISIIDDSKATVVVTGLSEPKQPIWLANYMDRFANAKSFLALGSTIDMEAGLINRAPEFYRKHSLEWLYRMFSQPKRTIPRVWRDLTFFWFLFLQKIGRYNNPFEN